MVQFLVDASVIGTPKHLLCTNGSLCWVDDVPKDVLRWTRYADTDSLDSLNVAIKLSGHDIKFKFEPKYIESLCTVLPSYRFNRNIDIPWHNIAPTRFASSAIKRLVADLTLAMQNTDAKYYTDVFVRQNDLFSSMKPAHINLRKLEEIIVTSNRKSFLTDFLPDHNGFAQPVTYNRIQQDESGTKTGRLTISSGPSFMTLNREYREIIDSRYEDGAVWYLDYSSLEPRTFQAYLGKSLPRDFYTSLARDLLGDSGRTTHAKSMFLRRFFGAGYDVMAADGESTIEQAKKFAKCVDEDFGVREMTAKLVAEFKSSGHIHNNLGRVLIPPKDSAPHVLFNWCAQSTAVDVALLGFSKICRSINKSSVQITPVCVIHDALIVDVHPTCQKYIPLLTKLGSSIPEIGPAEFFMHCERIS